MRQRVWMPALVVLAAAAWIAVAGRLSVWFDLWTRDFGGGFVAPGDTREVVLIAACAATGVLALATIIRPAPRLVAALAIATLVLSVGGLYEWWSEATVDADLPAGTVRETSVGVMVSPSTAGWLVLLTLVALQAAALTLLPRRRPIAIAISALTVATLAIGLLAPDRLVRADHPISITR